MIIHGVGFPWFCISVFVCRFLGFSFHLFYLLGWDNLAFSVFDEKSDDLNSTLFLWWLLYTRHRLLGFTSLAHVQRVYAPSQYILIFFFFFGTQPWIGADAMNCMWGKTKWWCVYSNELHLNCPDHVLLYICLNHDHCNYRFFLVEFFIAAMY